MLKVHYRKKVFKLSYPIYAPSDSEIKDDSGFYELRGFLDKQNYRIAKIMEETTLKLSTYRMEDDGFWTISLDQIVELLENGHQQKPVFYKFRDANNRDCVGRIREAITELQAKCAARRKFLPEYQKMWREARTLPEGTDIYYGLDYVLIMIPIESLVKYQIFFEPPGLFSAYRRCFTQRSGELYFGFVWNELALEAFDAKLCFLEWKAEEYQKQNCARVAYQDFQTQCRGFAFWEKATFGTSSAPP